MKDKVQVGKDVWIKPSSFRIKPEGSYFFIGSEADVIYTVWDESAGDYALLQVGNCFPTRESAEAAIIKPVDTTPVTYEQWVKAGKPEVFGIDSLGAVYSFRLMRHDLGLYFEVHKLWLTKESAKAWLDNWKKLEEV